MCCKVGFWIDSTKVKGDGCIIIYTYMKWFAHLVTAKCSQTSMVPQNHSFLFIYSLPMETAQTRLLYDFSNNLTSSSGWDGFETAAEIFVQPKTWPKNLLQMSNLVVFDSISVSISWCIWFNHSLLVTYTHKHTHIYIYDIYNYKMTYIHKNNFFLFGLPHFNICPTKEIYYHVSIL